MLEKPGRILGPEPFLGRVIDTVRRMIVRIDPIGRAVGVLTYIRTGPRAALPPAVVP